MILPIKLAKKIFTITWINEACNKHVPIISIKTAIPSGKIQIYFSFAKKYVKKILIMLRGTKAKP